MEDLVKVAYGIGCISQLNELGVAPEDFVKTAAASDDDALRTAADAVLCVAHYSEADPQGTEKVASIINEPVREPTLMERLGLA